MANVGTAYLHIMPETKGIKSELTKAVSGGATTAGKTAGLNLVGAIKGAIAGAGIAAFFHKALTAGGDLQQSFGGLETIYGDAAEGMKKMSYEAAQAGISANSYAEQAVSFGAALRQAYGGDMTKAAKAADTAIMDMADNSAKMGTNIQDIQNAYQGFAKQNYTMLDNLKLGYGGTKQEMQRLLSDAEKLSGVKYDISNLGDVYDAIHVIQEDLKITGVAAQEGATTLTGSFNAMKASATNLIANMSLGKDIKGPLKDLGKSAKNFLLGNVFPMVGNTLVGIGSVVGEGLKTGLRKIPNLVESAKGFLGSLADAIQNNGGDVVGKIVSGAKILGGYFKNAFTNTDWAGLGASIVDLIKTGATTFGPILWEGIKSLGSTAAEWFKSVDWSETGRNAIQLIGTGIGTLGNWLGTGIRTLADKASDFFERTDWSEAGEKAVGLIGTGIKTVGTFLWETLKSLGNVAKEKFKEIDWKSVGGSIVRFIGSGAKAIGTFLWSALKTIGSAAAEKIKGIDWKGVGGSIIRFIGSGAKAIGSFIWNGIKGIGESAIEKFKGIDWAGAGSAIINFIVNGITTIGSTVWGWMENIGTNAKNKILEIDWIQAGIDIITAIVSGINEVGENIREAIVGFAKSAWEFVKTGEWKDVGEEGGDKYAQGIANKQGEVKTKADVVKSAALGVFFGGSAEADSAGNSTGSSYAEGIGSGPNRHSASSHASSLVTAAKSAMDVGWAWDSGKTLGENFAAGISYAHSAIQTAAANAAAIVAKFMRHSTPEAGPLHDDDKWGTHLVDNFTNGMKKGIPAIKNAALQVANAAVIDPAALTYNPAYATASGQMMGGSANGVTQNFYVNGSDSPELWARRAMREAHILARAT